MDQRCDCTVLCLFDTEEKKNIIKRRLMMAIIIAVIVHVENESARTLKILFFSSKCFSQCADEIENSSQMFITQHKTLDEIYETRAILPMSPRMRNSRPLRTFTPSVKPFLC